MSIPLLLDAIERMHVNPTAVHGWHRFFHLYKQLAPQLQADALARLCATTPDDGVPGFLKETLLAYVGGGTSHGSNAARILLELRPVDPDRISAFLMLVWWTLVKSEATRATFLASLAAAHFPQLQRLAAHALQADTAPLPPRPVRHIRRIAIVANHLADLRHTPTKMALDQLSVLQSLGYDVALFSTQEQTPPDMSSYLGADCDSSTKQLDTTHWQQYLNMAPGSSFDTSAADMRFSMRQRWRYVSAALEHFDPDLVFSVGMFSPLLFSLYQSRPVLSLCVHAFAPSTPCDVWLCADPALAGRESMHWGAQLPPSYASFHPFRIAHRCTPGLTTRAELGLTQDRLIVISIGDRLHAEITGAWAQAMLALLARRPDICWLLVGGAGQLPASLATAAPESVRPLPAQDSVGDLLALSDIYLNPPRVGGGFSVADAMAEALPVVSFGDSDGGIKIGALAVANMTAYFTYLDALLASTPLRASTGAALRACFENTLSLAHSHQSLDAAINITLNRFNARSAPS